MRKKKKKEGETRRNKKKQEETRRQKISEIIHEKQMKSNKFTW